MGFLSAVLSLYLVSSLVPAWDGDCPMYWVDRGLYRGCPPRTRADFDRLHALGVRVILDLQSFWPLVSEREQRLAAEYGIVYLNCPIDAGSPDTLEIEMAFQQLLRWRGYPLYLHCQQNRDRTSLLVALYRVRCQGWSLQAAYEEMLRFGLRDSLPFYSRYFWENASKPLLLGRW